MKLQKNQSGFSAIEAVLILVIIAIIGVVGYLVYNANQTANDNLKSSSNITTPKFAKQASKTASTAASSTVSAQQYMVIKEWGVRVKVDTSTSSLYYFIDSSKPDDAYLSFHTVDAVAPNCAADKISLAAYFRQTTAQYNDALQNPSDTNMAGTIKIGNYYYGAVSSKADCTDGTDAMRAAVAKVTPAQSPLDIFKSIEAIPTSN